MIRILMLLVFVFPASVPPQVKHAAKQDTSATLKDAEYALRRFQGVAARVDFNHWKVPDQFRQMQVEALGVTSAQVRDALNTISRVAGSRKSLSGVDMLSIYSALVSSGGELADLSYNTLDFQDKGSSDLAKVSEANALGTELMRASATTMVTAAKLYVILRRQIVAEEKELMQCRARPR